MIFQILIYGLFISEIKDQNFLLDFSLLFFLPKFKLGFKKKKGQVHGEGVQICIAGVQNNFLKKNIIYIKNFGSGGSNNIPLPFSINK